MKTMKKLNLILPIMSLLTMIFGCGEITKPAADWTKAKKIAGKEQKLSHVSGLVVDDKFAFVTVGGNLADQKEGLSGLRKVALDSGAVTVLDDGKDMPQSDYGGVVSDEKFVYWNIGGTILRVSKETAAKSSDLIQVIQAALSHKANRSFILPVWTIFSVFQNK